MLRLLTRGLSNRAIAERLVISPQTVGTHIEHIYAKIDASSRATASLFAMQHGLLPDEELASADCAARRRWKGLSWQVKTLLRAAAVLLLVLILGLTAGESPKPASSTSGATVKSATPIAARKSKAGAQRCTVNGDLPDRRCTPGDVVSTSTARVCTPGYAASVRDVSAETKRAVYASYGIARHSGGASEVDHLIPLSLGGSNAVKNLWPEVAAGFKNKDAAEARLHDAVCAGALSLKRAQQLFARDWHRAAAWHATSPPPTTQASPPPPAPKTTPNPPPADTPNETRPSTPSEACAPGYSPCLPVTSDLDCADLSPSQKPVQVTGDDPYRLDRDGDGVGCESG